MAHRGYYHLKKAEIGGKSIMHMVQTCGIHESINNNYTTARIRVKDDFGFIDTMVLKGGEEFKIEFEGNDDDPYEFEFVIDEVVVLEKVKEHTIMDIELTSIHYTKLADDYAFIKDGTVSDIMTYFIEEEAGSSFEGIDDTSWNFKFMFSDWSGNDIIDFLEKRAVSSKSSKPYFRFYESKNKLFFKSIPDLMDEPKVGVLKPMNETDENGDSSSGPFTYQDIEIIRTNELSTSYKNGTRGSDVEIFDPFLKKYTKSGVDGVDKKSKTQVLKYKHDGKYSDSDDAHFEDMVCQRLAFEGSFDNFKIKVTVPGSSLMQLGEKVELTNPWGLSSNDDNDEGYFDEEFIISEIEYGIGDKFFRTLTLIREQKV